MRYDHPELAKRLAADYVLGLMPRRARWRFERAMARNATLAATVAGWSDRLAPLDMLTADETPSGQVWRAIERRVAPSATPAAPPRRTGRVFWRAVFATALTACAALAIYIALSPTPLSDTIEALAEKTGFAGWMDAAKHAPPDVGLSTINLGISERERPRWIRAALLLADDALPITAKPPTQSR
jgi:hypothetical protein